MYKHPVAIVTGASRGIGKAIASGLAQAGHKTILVARSKDQLKLAAYELKNTLKLDESLVPDMCVLDVTDEKKAKETLKQVVTTYKRLDVFVNNAGAWLPGSVEASPAKLKGLFDVNLFAPYMFLQMVVPIMKKQGSGYIFNVASRAGKVGFIESGSYCATKFGLVGLNESLYRELAPLGIRVTALCPGWVHTDMATEAGAELPAEEIIQPEDLGKTVQYLLSLSAHACVKEVVLECGGSVA
jgi:NAD(P)-dependent dehydrogenase (short-subunit alcohol dehydrogenase family)